MPDPRLSPMCSSFLPLILHALEFSVVLADLSLCLVLDRKSGLGNFFSFSLWGHFMILARIPLLRRISEGRSLTLQRFSKKLVLFSETSSSRLTKPRNQTLARLPEFLKPVNEEGASAFSLSRL
ncbi:hypothetical protein TorRG33x02_227470 [Trema orientale]|uniref:Transmembrane protein n=1 Tax=Trema orientale TaxID=63057 RepID=A0A2P5E7E8_TREOI|nr:hypothetical protein TorRG33x02_227470 [Trema orientale]